MRAAAGAIDPVSVETSVVRLCAACGDRVGVYEPIVAVDPAGPRETSLAREPALIDDDDTLLLHAGCSEWPRDGAS
jgi:hypothetical protein